MKPMFSILMCTYNSAATLDYAVQSVADQTYNEWELLILDNGSADNSVAMLKEYEKNDARIRCIYGENNVGWCKGISVLLDETRGRYMMFMGADDRLATENTLSEVAEEINKHSPQIIWTGFEYANFENGNFTTITQTVPEYRVYNGDNKLNEFYEIMRQCYYNSVMHYVEIEFLRNNNIDFYSPYHSDCGGMTEALARATKMVVMDKIEYLLTYNTSQTSKSVGYYTDICSQWRSFRSAVDKEIVNQQVSFIAGRILENMVAICENIAIGEPICDSYQNIINKNLAERFLRVETMISSDEMNDMLTCDGTGQYEKRLLEVLAVNYYACAKHKELHDKIENESIWAAKAMRKYFDVDDNGELNWKKSYSTGKHRVLDVEGR